MYGVQDAQYYRDAGEPGHHIVSMWIPVQPVTVENSCLELTHSPLPTSELFDGAGRGSMTPLSARNEKDLISACVCSLQAGLILRQASLALIHCIGNRLSQCRVRWRSVMYVPSVALGHQRNSVVSKCGSMLTARAVVISGALLPSSNPTSGAPEPIPVRALVY